MIKSIFKLTKFLINLKSDHLVAINHCLHYFYIIKNFDIKFSISNNEKLSILIDKKHFSNSKHIFEKTADVFFAINVDRKSNERFVFKLFDKLINWVSWKQTTVFTSITETELLTLFHADKEILWWIHLFQKLTFDFNHDVVIYNNNLRIIRFMNSKINRIDIKLKHINIAQYWLRKSIQMKNLIIKYFSTVDIIIDDFIKFLFLQKHNMIDAIYNNIIYSILSINNFNAQNSNFKFDAIWREQFLFIINQINMIDFKLLNIIDCQLRFSQNLNSLFIAFFDDLCLFIVMSNFYQFSSIVNCFSMIEIIQSWSWSFEQEKRCQEKRWIFFKKIHICHYVDRADALKIGREISKKFKSCKNWSIQFNKRENV